MLKAALLCSAICTAFVVGGPSPMPQDKPAKVANPVQLHEVLKSLVGKQCQVHSNSGNYYIRLSSNNKTHKLDMVGLDFIRVTTATGKTYIPFSVITYIKTD